jgi:hypothetical protein
MTNIYAHLADGDAPKSQHVTQVSFVDNSGKSIDFSAQLDDTGSALANLRKLTKLQSDAELADVITTVNAILDAVKAK